MCVLQNKKKRMCKFKEKHGNVDRCRAGFGKAIEVLEDEVDQQKELERASRERR